MQSIDGEVKNKLQNIGAVKCASLIFKRGNCSGKKCTTGINENLHETYRYVREPMFANDFGIAPDKRFTRRELHDHFSINSQSEGNI